MAGTLRALATDDDRATAAAAGRRGGWHGDDGDDGGGSDVCVSGRTVTGDQLEAVNKHKCVGTQEYTRVTDRRTEMRSHYERIYYLTLTVVILTMFGI